MTLYRKILIPTDGSENTKAAIAFALQMAKISGATVTALTVNDTTSYANASLEPAVDVDRFMAQRGKEAVTYVVDQGRSMGVSVTTQIINGLPAQNIAEASKGYDLVVMGTMGRTGMAHLLLGSVAENVVRNAHCPVMVVHADEEHIASECHSILIATDGGDHTKIAILHGLELAKALNAKVTALSVSDAKSDPGPARKDKVALRRIMDMSQNAVDDVVAEGNRFGLEVVPKVVTGSPANEIVKVSKGYDLVVMGTLGRSGLDLLRLGSVAEKTVRSSKCPVLVVRASDASQ